MAYDVTTVNRIMGAARARDFVKVEELWGDILAPGTVDDLKFLLDVAREVADRGDRTRAAHMLMRLREPLRQADRLDELFQVVRQAVVYYRKLEDARGDLVDGYRRRYGERPGFDALLSRTGLTSDGKLDEAVDQIERAFAFDEGDFVFHARGWGIGKVVETRPETGEFVIDFVTKKGQKMEAGMALSALTRRDPMDLDVLLWTDAGRVKTLAEEEPLQLLRSALLASGGKLQSRDLRDKLARVLDKTAWTRFWSRVRKEAKQDPRFEVGPAPKSEISLREQPLSREEEVSAELERRRRFADRLEIARQELLAIRRDTQTAPKWVAVAVDGLKRSMAKAAGHEKLANQLELALFQQELAQAWPDSAPGYGAEARVDPETGEPLPAALAAPVREAIEPLPAAGLSDVLRAFTITEYRRQAVALLPQVLGEGGTVEPLRKLLLDPAPQTWEPAAEALRGVGQAGVILEVCNQLAIRPQEYPDAYCAMARAHFNGRLAGLDGRSDTEILAKAIQVSDAVTLEKATADKAKGAALKATIDAYRNLFSEKQQRVFREVIEKGSEDEVRRVLQLVRQSPSLTPTVKRTAEGFVVERFPELLSTVVAAPRFEEHEEEPPVFTTAEGKRKREQLLNKLLHEDLERVRIAIGKALEFGDISENSELDEARREQQQLAERAERMRVELERAVVIDLNEVPTDKVGVGTRVVVEDPESGDSKAFTILGPWDIDDEDPSIISHLSPMAQGLLGTPVGGTATVKLPNGALTTWEVKSIERPTVGVSH